MTPSDAHEAAQGHTQYAESTLMRWVEEAKRSIESDKLDGLARARLGELVLNACRYLCEREEIQRKAALVAQIRADAEKRSAARKHHNPPTGLLAARQEYIE